MILSLILGLLASTASAETRVIMRAVENVDLSTGPGNSNTGTIRVIIANDSPAGAAPTVNFTTVTIATPNNNTTAIPVSGSLSVAFTTVTVATPNNNTVALPANVNGSTVGVVNSGAPLDVRITTVPYPASQAVTGTFFQGTQPVSLAVAPTTPVTGTFFQAIQPVVLASTGAVNVATGTITAVLTAAQLSTLTPLATVAVTGAYQAIQPVVLASTGAVNIATGTITAVLNPETTKVIGTVNVAAGQTIGVTGTFFQTVQPISLPSGQGVPVYSTSPVSISLSSGTPATPLSVVWASTPPVTIVNSTVAIVGLSGSANIPVTGTFWQAIQPTSLPSGQGVPVYSTAPISISFSSGTSTTPLTVVWPSTPPVTVVNSTAGVVFAGGVAFPISFSSGTPTTPLSVVWVSTPPVTVVNSTMAVVYPGGQAFPVVSTTPVALAGGTAEVGNVKNSGTFAVQASQSGTWTVQQSTPAATTTVIVQTSSGTTTNIGITGEYELPIRNNYLNQIMAEQYFQNAVRMESWIDYGANNPFMR